MPSARETHLPNLPDVPVSTLWAATPTETMPGAQPVTPPVGAHVSYHPELSYCLDSAVELGEISPIEHLVLTVDTEPARALLARYNAGDDSWSPHWLRNTARQFLDTLTLPERYVIALGAVPHLEQGLQALQERMEYVVEQRVLVDLGKRESLSGLLASHEPELVAAMPTQVFTSVSDVDRDTVQAFAQPLFAPSLARMQADIELTRDALGWWSQGDHQQVAQEIAQRLLRAPLWRISAAAELPGKKHQVAQQRKLARQAKGAIKKAVKLLTRFGADHNARLLVSGEEVVISHPDSAFQFRLQAHKGEGWLVQRTVMPGGHVPYQLTLQTKAGDYLARLCVLFDKTPVLDQLLALTMFVQTGNERDLLEKANWFGIENPNQVRQCLLAVDPELAEKVVPTEQRARTLSGSLVDQLWPERTFWAAYKGPVRSWLAEALLPSREIVGQLQACLTPQEARALPAP